LPSTFATWFAISASVGIAIFIGVLLYRHKEAPAGGFIIFAVFASLPIVLLSLPELLPRLVNYCVETPRGKYCLGQLAQEVKSIQGIANSAQADANRAVTALQQSVDAVPFVQTSHANRVLQTESTKSAQTKSVISQCRPYTYTDGFTPSPGLLVVGSGKSNWFPVVSSIYDKDKALNIAKTLSPLTAYPVEVYSARDASGVTVWAVTLGGHLSQDEAVARVCWAQDNKAFQKDSYAWASDKWGANVRLD
jgi:hypothetical protein